MSKRPREEVSRSQPPTIITRKTESSRTHGFTGNRPQPGAYYGGPSSSGGSYSTRAAIGSHRNVKRSNFPPLPTHGPYAESGGDASVRSKPNSLRNNPPASPIRSEVSSKRSEVQIRREAAYETTSSQTNQPASSNGSDDLNRSIMKGLGVKARANLAMLVPADPLKGYGTRGVEDETWVKSIMPGIRENKVSNNEANIRHILLNMYLSLLPLGITGDRKSMDGMTYLTTIEKAFDKSGDAGLGKKPSGGYIDDLMVRGDEEFQTQLGDIVQALPMYIIEGILGVDEETMMHLNNNRQKKGQELFTTNSRIEEVPKYMVSCFKHVQESIEEEVFMMMKQLEGYRMLEEKILDLQQVYEEKQKVLDELVQKNYLIANARDVNLKGLLHENVSTAGMTALQLKNEKILMELEITTTNKKLTIHEERQQKINNMMFEFSERTNTLREYVLKELEKDQKKK